MAQQRRVLLLDMPQMLAEIVRDVVSRDDSLVVVGDIVDADARAVVGQMRPNIVLLGGDSTSPPAWCREVFEERPHFVVLALLGSGRDAVLWELAPHRVPLGDLAPSALLSAMRDVRVWRWDT
jgi:hypothetical protein